MGAQRHEPAAVGKINWQNCLGRAETKKGERMLSVSLLGKAKAGSLTEINSFANRSLSLQKCCLPRNLKLT